jgi:prephenate dehydrogenase
MKIVVVDGQGGRLGRLLVEEVKARLPQAQVYALGTNTVATAAMLKAGADFGATGENPVVRNVADADGVLGPVGIVVANAILGEVTPAMAEAVGSCRAKKFLIPMNSCGVVVAGVEELPLSAYVSLAAEALAAELKKD